MESEVMYIIYNSIMVIIFLFIILITRKYRSNQEENVIQYNEKFFQENKEEVKKDNTMDQFKMEIEHDIQEKSTIMAQKAKKSLRMLDEEIINQGNKILSQFSIDLKSAIPKDKKERNKDMNDLMEAVKTLEEHDKEHYIEKNKGDDIGKSMFYDQMTSRLFKLMKKEKLNEIPILVFDKVIYLGLKNLKNINETDMINSLRYMKESGYINDYIEINPKLIFILQAGKKIKFTNPEKVILAFCHEEENITIPILMEKAKWSKSYTNRIVNNLIKKEIAELIKDKINIKVFETAEEKHNRINLKKEIEENIKQKDIEHKKEQESLEEDFKEIFGDIFEESPENFSENQKEEKSHKENELLKIKKEAVETKKLKASKIPTVKSLKLPSKTSKKLKIVKSTLKKVPKPSTEVKLTEDEIIGVDENLKKKITEYQEMDKDVQKSIETESEKYDISDIDFDSLIGSEFVGGEQEDTEISKEAIIDGVMSIFEKFEHINGGLMDIRLVLYLLQELYTNITLKEVEKTVNDLKEMGLVTREIKIGNLTILMFKDKKLDKKMLELLEKISIFGWMTKEEISKSLNWDEEKTLLTMKKLQDIEVLRLDPDNKVIIPGLVVDKN